MPCCSNCFTHGFLRDFIKTSSSKTGKCTYCTSKNNQAVCDPSILTDLFQPVFDLYTVSTSGIFINDQIQLDWQIFSKDVSTKQQQKLLSDIVSDKKLVKKKVISRFSQVTTLIDKWNDFKNELQHENRFFPKKAIKREELEELISYLAMKKEDYPDMLYRARVKRTLISYCISEMGKPPKEKATAGRANPQGIPYYYLASDQRTAISETRPYKSENVCVGKYKVSKKAKFIDLREPKKVICPIGLDENSLYLLYKEHMPFLGHLCYTLSIPVLPYQKDLDYLPTQYLCELIKDQYYDGIAFKSSLAKGDNYVIFNDSILNGTNVDTYTIDDTVMRLVKVRT